MSELLAFISGLVIALGFLEVRDRMRLARFARFERRWLRAEIGPLFD